MHILLAFVRIHRCRSVRSVRDRDGCFAAAGRPAGDPYTTALRTRESLEVWITDQNLPRQSE
jgi:hypothetical protein